MSLKGGWQWIAEEAMLQVCPEGWCSICPGSRTGVALVPEAAERHGDTCAWWEGAAGLRGLTDLGRRPTVLCRVLGVRACLQGAYV